VSSPPDAVWNELRRRLWWEYGLLAAWFPVIFFFGWLPQHAGISEVVAIGLAMLWILPMFLADRRLYAFPCPSCGRRFLRRGQAWPRSCAHCGLKAWAPLAPTSVE
jgi:hypothetical protein